MLNVIRKLASPSLRYEAREINFWLRERFNLARFWNWKVSKFSLRAGGSYKIIYIGRNTRLDWAKALLNGNRGIDISPTENFVIGQRVFVSEVPFPGAICIPALLSSIIPLGRPIEDITANYHSQLRRELKKNRIRYRFQQVQNESEIEYLDREMLRPYAGVRHGVDANQVELSEVKRLALEYGRFDLLLLGDEKVGCQLGHVITRSGKRYWSTNRCGYPAAVFSDPKQLRDTNSINIFLALEWAIENGYDYYNIGVSLGRPGDGLLEWKRRRGGELDTMGNSGYFHVRLPDVGAAQFLWDSPLFAVKNNKLVLHLGLPEGPSNEEVASRYREMGFGGLVKVYLHCATTPSEQVLDSLRSLYLHQKLPPVVEIITST